MQFTRLTQIVSPLRRSLPPSRALSLRLSLRRRGWKFVASPTSANNGSPSRLLNNLVTDRGGGSIKITSTVVAERAIGSSWNSSNRCICLLECTPANYITLWNCIRRSLEHWTRCAATRADASSIIYIYIYNCNEELYFLPLLQPSLYRVPSLFESLNTTEIPGRTPGGGGGGIVGLERKGSSNETRRVEEVGKWREGRLEMKV